MYPDEPIPIEICIACDEVRAVKSSVEAAFRGGADRVELCARMDAGGTTPDAELIRMARRSFGDRPGLLVMIRPRGGDFAYSNDEIRAMHTDIDIAAAEGADGVVFGVVQDGAVDRSTCSELISSARSLGLQASFHRAFDAITDRSAGLEHLIELGIDRILTAGAIWSSSSSVLSGMDVLSNMIRQSDHRVEIVAGGGIRPENASQIAAELTRAEGLFSLHAYSGVLVDGITNAERVSQFIRNASGLDRENPAPDPTV
jgi:copper homeostasis protein